MAQQQRHYTRVAVVQLDVHPAATVDRRTPLEDPIFEFGKPDSLLPGNGQIPKPEIFNARFELLRQTIRETYCSQLKARVLAILAACQRWRVKIVVFPEYSIPYDILGAVSDNAGDMVVVAGTHAVDRRVLESGLYERLGWHGEDREGDQRPLPKAGMAVCPVLAQNRLLALQPKLHAAKPEAGSLRVGKSWAPVELPGTFPGPLGLLICKDFLSREDDAHRKYVGDQLDRCRFLAVPSLTPSHTIREFGENAWTEARRYGRPVLYSNVAGRTGAGRADLGGGSSIFVDEGQPGDLRRFPDEVGLLAPANEGVIVADVDLGWQHVPHASTRFDVARPIVPFAAASLVDHRHPASHAYATFLESFAPRLDALTDDDDLDELIDELSASRECLLTAAALTNSETRNRRLQRMFDGLNFIHSASELAKFTREIVLPPDVLPLSDLRSVLALATADVFDAWTHEHRGTGLTEVEERLRTAGQKAATLDSAEWTDAGKAVASDVRSVFREFHQTKKRDLSALRGIEFPDGISPSAFTPIEKGNLRLVFARDELGVLSRIPDEWRYQREPGEDHLKMSYLAYQFVGCNHIPNLMAAEGATLVTSIGAWHSQPSRGATLCILKHHNEWTLVRGLSDLKKEEPFQLPLWEVLTQYFFTRRPLEWLLPVKLAQNEVAVDP
jgi:predicted amidohydrolase